MSGYEEVAASKASSDKRNAVFILVFWSIRQTTAVL